jgi:uncharacterized protein YjbI with pentapeptide repeats
VAAEASSDAPGPLERRDLRERSFEGERLYRVVLRESDVSGTSFRDAFVASGDLSGIRAVGTDFRGANLSRAQLPSATLLRADFRGANLFGANLHDADLRGAQFEGADLSRVRFSWAHLVKTRLAGAQGVDASIFDEAACWDLDTTWPEGLTPPAAASLCLLHNER